MSEAQPDAERIDGIPGNRPRRKPVHAAIWIRIAGSWQRGAIYEWVWGEHGELLAWLQHDPLDGSPWPELALFRYSEAIRPRATGQLPPDRWRQTITPEDAAPFRWRAKGGTRRYRAGLPPCPGCGCAVERAYGDQRLLQVLPCGQRLDIE